MVSSEVLAMELLGPGDVDGGLALSDAAGWNQSADDWAFFIAAGAAFGVRDERGALIATAAALPYDAVTGWVSMVLVDAAHRHRGIAGQLVDACVASLRTSGRTPVLDATPAGSAVYEKIGFVAGFAFERWEGQGTPIDGDDDGDGAGSAGSIGVGEPSASQVATVIELDRSAGGVDREALLRAFLARSDTRVALAARGDGFVLSRAGRRATQIGPLVAVDSSSALVLLEAALAGVTGRIFIDVPGHCTQIADELARWGFVRQRPFVRMALGDPSAAAARRDVFALAGPEFG